MVTLDSVSFLTISGEVISIAQVFSCLQLFGQLQPFVQNFLRYYALYKEIQEHDGLVVTATELAQTVIDFRLRSGLTDPDRFGQWLSGQGLDYTTFENQVVVSLKLEKLKAHLVEARAQAYLESNRTALEQVEVYYIVVAEEEIAHQIQAKITSGVSFEQIAQEYPLDAEQKVLVKRDLLRRQQLRDEIKTAAETANLKELIGPIAMGSRWCLFQIEQIVSVALDDAMKQELKDPLFNQWLTEKLESLKVEAATPVTQTSADVVSSRSVLPTEASESEEESTAELPVGV